MSATAARQPTRFTTPTFDPFLNAYPRHHVTQRLGRDEPPPSIDGRLDDAAWAAARWTSQRFVDITEYVDLDLNFVADGLQSRAKFRWDASFLYVGAELRTPFVFARAGPSHNRVAPYHDNDFELFLDPSGSTQGYVEFEVSVRNATYDVLWGVPDGDSRQCDGGRGPAYLPTCVNTSFPGYRGSWTMLNTQRAGRVGGGLSVATQYDPEQYGRFASPAATWTVEMALPLRSGAGHGGLLDGVLAASMSEHDPAASAQVYWLLNLARAVHPRRFNRTAPASGHAFCPLGCDPSLEHAQPELSPPSVAECSEVLAAYPTILGVQPYSCYWEYVYQSLGPDAYMHRPLRWAILQFAPPPAPQRFPFGSRAPPDGECRMVEWPGRYMAANILYAQDASKAISGRYLTSLAGLVSVCARGIETRRGRGREASERPPTVPRCDAAALRVGLVPSPYAFRLALTVQANASTLTAECPARPCFQAVVHATAPLGKGVAGYEYKVSIDSNSKLQVMHSKPAGDRPCL
jgi:hypothetical protein